MKLLTEKTKPCIRISLNETLINKMSEVMTLTAKNKKPGELYSDNE